MEASITPDDESKSTLPDARRTGMPIIEQSEASKSALAPNRPPEKSHFADPFKESPRLNSKSRSSRISERDLCPVKTFGSSDPENSAARRIDSSSENFAPNRQSPNAAKASQLSPAESMSKKSLRIDTLSSLKPSYSILPAET